MASKQLSRELIQAKYRNDNVALIKVMNLWGNNLGDVSLLLEMTNLEVLNLTKNLITSLRNFKNCTQLTELYLRGNYI